MQKKTIGIVTALKREADLIFGIKTSKKIFTIYNDSKFEIINIISGMGKANAYAASQKLIEKKIDIIGSIGVSGGLCPTFSTGDIVIADKILDYGATDNDKIDEIEVNGKFAKDISEKLKQSQLHVKIGSIITSKIPICSSNQKLKLYMKTNAIAVDMESAAIAKSAVKANIPFFVIRSISDNAKTSLPSTLNNFIDDKGNPIFSKFFLNLAKKPSLMLNLFEMQKDFKCAVKSLGIAYQSLQSILV